MGCTATSVVAEDTVFVVDRVGAEGGEEARPYGGLDEDGIAKENEGRVRVCAATECVAELGAVRGRDVGFYGGDGGGGCGDGMRGRKGVEGGERNSGRGGERCEVARRGREDVVQGVGSAYDVCDYAAHDGLVPRRADGRLPLRPAQPVRGAVVVHGEVLDLRRAFNDRGSEQPSTPPAGDLRQQRDVLIRVPALQLLPFVGTHAQAQNDKDVLRRLWGYCLEGRERGRLLAGDEVVNESPHSNLLHSVFLPLRLDAVGAQGCIGFFDEFRCVGHVVDREPFGEALAGAVEIAGAVAEAVGEEGQTQTEGSVLVVPPVVELSGGKTGVWCHGHVEKARGGRHIGGLVEAVARLIKMLQA